MGYLWFYLMVGLWFLTGIHLKTGVFIYNIMDEDSYDTDDSSDLDLH
ncbi:hypothetical protein LCGC14_1159960 [marine sediment metagenome]|uniref:Uncharacterized protein n=1 Tax=marine sediment metagenome TaxID=412755 RepID=A0A0F9PB85_9ZZZZ